ncbi:MAG TPA: GNAT family N-acetyltransferase [Gemmatimonadaceae bacterium]|nr:GNAT family N-acetyltransferase [Gemmatimonadaceae bacterium]
MQPASIRSLGESDLGAARELLRDAVPVESQLPALLSVLENSALAPGDEQRGLIAHVGGGLVAVAVHGEFAGTAGAGRLHLIAVARQHRRSGIGSLLLERIISELGARGTRFILAELPEERPALDDYFAFLAANGFIEESRIPNFHEEGVALVFLRR